MSKFSNFSNFLSSQTTTKVCLSFDQIETIIGQKLCRSAYIYRAYWNVSKTHMLPLAWHNEGWQCEHLDFDRHMITLVKKIDVTSRSKLHFFTKESKQPYILKKPMIDIKTVLTNIALFHNANQEDENARFRSWEHCYRQFEQAKQEHYISDEYIDYLSLHLGFYLASWGMMRGSSFLLQKDYRVHREIVKEILKNDYSALWHISCSELNKQENINALIKLIENLKLIYRSQRDKVKNAKVDISDTLVTKVLLGTLGCLPAYDNLFKSSILKYNVAQQKLGERSIKDLAAFYLYYKDALEEQRRIVSNARGIEYPQMKILDMAFWQMGMDK